VPDLSFLRVFGCYVIPPRQHRPGILEHDVRTGIYLGHAKTPRNILYYDIVSHEVKEAGHVSFDETSFDVKDKSPNAELLMHLHAGEPFDEVFETPVDMDIVLSPFLTTHTLEVSYDRQAAQKRGMTYTECSDLGRAFIYDLNTAPTNRTLKWFRKNYEYSYVVPLAGNRIYNANDVQEVLRKLDETDVQPERIEITLAPERRANLRVKPTPYADARPNISKRSKNLHANERRPPTLLASMTLARPPSRFFYCRPMTEEEKQLKNFSYRNLKSHSNWSEWKAARDNS
jgi:hypothetical protein